jgi:hypothetical protein
MTPHPPPDLSTALGHRAFTRVLVIREPLYS